MDREKPIILSGVQPTGQLHLGNYEGALRNWVSMQDDYRMYLCVVDWHALTSDFNEVKELQDRIFQTMLDFLCSGLDPEKVSIFIQSDIKEHAELHLLFSMIIPTPWLERVPSYKEKSEAMGLDSYGFLGYPLLQAADILLYKADFVPVGKDQLPHIELTREVARRFNNLYGNVFPEPGGLLSKFPLIPGIDGRKMSKSYNNDIKLGDSPDETAQKLKKMITDPNKIYKGDPGRPEICPVFALHQVYTNAKDVEKIARTCKSGELGCVEDKKLLGENLNTALENIRSKRKELEKNKDYVLTVLDKGAAEARERAVATMSEVRKSMNLVRSYA
ncbi:MAG: tryptophan--tRNA ligase [Candidatus Zixiibacteriota bacterium]|nr:MAG: tryptophan--tRNA ligase [candidate division Zixibacteria bacterium]